MFKGPRQGANRRELTRTLMAAVVQRWFATSAGPLVDALMRHGLPSISSLRANEVIQ